ncbi:MAG: type II secretory pathway component PulJ [Chlamydiales bacterium]|jgi:type II secretory pathway component PulJ
MRNMTLIELLISLLLGAILLSGLFGFYYKVNQEDIRLERERANVESWQYTHQRLLNVMSKLTKSTKSTNFNRKPPVSKENTFFFTEDNSNLIFTHAHRTTSLSGLSSNVLSRLYVDKKKHRLCLITWSLPEQNNQKKETQLQHHYETLMENVSELSFNFYHFDYEKNQWSTPQLWNHKEIGIPEYIKFSITMINDSEKLELVCPLKHSTSHTVTILRGS